MQLNEQTFKMILISSVVVMALVRVTDCSKWPLKSKSSGPLFNLQLSATNSRIYGGQEAKPGSWPWQVVILDHEGELKCGGFVLNSTFVLTAAHCLRHGCDQVRIAAGAHNIDKKDHYWQERTAIKHFIHPEYVSRATENVNDIALLQLNHPLSFGERVKPALLPQQGDELEWGSKATIIGWGETNRSRNSKVLLEAEVPINDEKSCDIMQYNQRVICAGADGVDTCYGDSGGPLMFKKEDGLWYVFGITSYSPNDCGVGAKGVYTKTSSFIHWIRDIQPDS